VPIRHYVALGAALLLAAGCSSGQHSLLPPAGGAATQSVKSGARPGGLSSPPGGRRPLDTSTPLPTTVLNTLWRVVVSGPQRMSTWQSSERNAFTSEGQIWYAPTGSLGSTTQTLYRLFQASIPDHMDSPTPGEGGYSTDGPIANPWNSSSAPTGTAQLLRAYNPTAHVHALLQPNESLSGFTQIEPDGLYGYPRYNLTAESLLGLSAGGVTVQSNKVAGGSVWTWTWNGTQFINHDDYGREMQADILVGNDNPTEAGAIADQSVPTQDKHGSPLVSASNSDSTQSTRAVPLEFDPGGRGYTNNKDQAVIYKDVVIGKDLTLNYNGMGAVAKYTTYLSVPTALSNAQVEIPATYLPSGHSSGQFEQFYTYDATTDTFAQYPLGQCSKKQVNIDSSPPLYGSGYGGVVISDDSGANALGVYGVGTTQGGSVSYMTLWDLTGSGCSFDTTKFSAVYGPGGIAAGASTYNTYIVTGTTAQVHSLMHQLYLAGAK
jgi:hypothetical protein